MAKTISNSELVETIKEQGSEGSKEEVKTGKIYKSCGDWNMLYHLEELEKQSNDILLSKIIKKIREPQQ
jgi:hypothetical protein